MLGTYKITAVIRGLLRNKATKALTARFQPVIDNDIRLMAANHPHQFRRSPRLTAQLVIGIVEPENVDLPIIRDQLLDLPVHIGQVAVKVDFFIQIHRVSAYGMVDVLVLWVVRMMPVDQRIIQPHAKPLCAYCVHKLAHQIASAGRICAFIVRQLGVK